MCKSVLVIISLRTKKSKASIKARNVYFTSPSVFKSIWLFAALPTHDRNITLHASARALMITIWRDRPATYNSHQALCPRIRFACNFCLCFRISTTSMWRKLGWSSFSWSLSAQPSKQCQESSFKISGAHLVIPSDFTSSSSWQSSFWISPGRAPDLGSTSFTSTTHPGCQE